MAEGAGADAACGAGGDRMTWVKVDDKLPSNVKVRSVTVPARWAYIASICYAGANRTDGFIPNSALALLDGTAKIAGELVTAGLWEKASGGWCIHDYLVYNRSKTRIESLSETNAKNAANRKGTVSDPSYLSSASVPTTSSPPIPLRKLATEAESESLNESLDESLLRVWERETGTLTNPRMAEDLDFFGEKFPRDWVKDAISETARQGKRSTKYTQAILERWADQGRGESKKPDDFSRFANDPIAAAAAAFRGGAS